MELGWRSVRPCDVCGTESARWYCAADEAYLCERCDDTVHSANALAGRHDRVCMAPNGAPMKIQRRSKGGPTDNSTSAIKGPWRSINQIRKRRIPPSSMTIPPSFNTLIKEEPCDDRQIQFKTSHKLHGLEEEDGDENDDYRKDENYEDRKAEERECIENFVVVPQIVFKNPSSTMEVPFLHDPSEVIDRSLCFSSHLSPQFSHLAVDNKGFSTVHRDLSNPNLGNTCLETLDFMDWYQSSNPEISNDQTSILIEEDYNCLQDTADGIVYPFKGEVERKRVRELEDDSDSTFPHSYPWFVRATSDLSCSGPSYLLNSLSLKLNYEDILSEWSDRGPLWSDGQRPQTVPDIFAFEHAISSEGGNMYQQEPQQEVPVMDYSYGVVNSAEREARVMRYREKRQSRLFAKKIRYEVRKLNAERRPRMKGRFIKRTSFTEECTV